MRRAAPTGTHTPVPIGPLGGVHIEDRLFLAPINPARLRYRLNTCSPGSHCYSHLSSWAGSQLR